MGIGDTAENRWLKQMRSSRIIVFLVTFAVVFIGIVWATVLLTVSFEYDAEVRSLVKINANLIKIYREYVHHNLMMVDNQLLFLKEEYEKRAIVTPVIASSVENLKTLPVNQIIILNSRGDLVESLLPLPTEVNVNGFDDDFFAVHLEADSGKPFIAKPQVGRISGKWSFHVSRRLNNPDGSFGGVAAIALDPAYFSNFYGRMDLASGQLVSMVGLDGVVRARQSGEDRAIGQDLSSTRLFKYLKEADSGYFISGSDSNGARRIFSYQAMPDYPVVLVVGVSEAEALAEFYNRREKYFIAAAVVSLFIVGAIGVLIRMILARQRAEKIQHVLYQISETASSLNDPEKIYRSVHQAISELIPAKDFYIATYDEKDGMIRYPYRVDEFHPAPGSRPFGKGLPEYVIETGAPLFADPQKRAELEAQGKILPVELPAVDWLGVPLKTADNKVFGIMAVKTYTQGVRFTVQDRDVLAFVSNQVAMAIERMRANENMYFLSRHDALTGLYNRAHFEQELKRLQEDGTLPVTLIICDVDGLKFINDTLGHAMGDQLLVATGEILRAAVEVGGTIARIGGDEFAIILPSTDARMGDAICKKIRGLLKKYGHGQFRVPLSLSMGCAAKGEGAASLQQVLIQADNYMYREKLHQSRAFQDDFGRTVIRLLESRDFMPEGHAERMQDMAVKLAQKIGLPKKKIVNLSLLARFHDIGKVGVPDWILTKPGPLTLEESKEMQGHCDIGYRIARSSPDLLPIAEWVLKHHEWWNGMGYPLGLSGEEIPVECRILAIVDAFDAMTNDRPYRSAMQRSAAVAELRRCAGTQFDPTLVEQFLEICNTAIG
ncbi:MAG: diguanylate cyclase [Negativicutes bacterium]|nr:diguanylate cyclase [Negativicutes bacterium]